MTIALPPAAAPDIVSEFATALGADAVSVAAHDRLLYARDMYPVSLMHMAEGTHRHFPDLIVRPANTAEVVTAVRLAKKHRLPVIPYGAGSGVCGGTLPVRGGVMLDVKRMNRVLAVNDADLTVTAQSGVMGQTLENHLNHRGYTLGHFPSSIHCSTLGGWVAARSAGQNSSKYGKIEDMVTELEWVMPGGEVIRTAGLTRAGGPDVRQLMIGSEGTLGVCTEAVCRISPAPEERLFIGYYFPDVPTGVETMRLIMQNGLRPAAMRLYDPLDTMMVGKSGPEEDSGGGLMDYVPIQQIEAKVRTLIPKAFRRTQRALAGMADVMNRAERFAKDGCLMILMFEGERRVAQYEYEAAMHVAERLGGKSAGPAPALRWFKNRHHVSYKMSKVFYNGAFVDTIEVACPWARIGALYEDVRAAIKPLAFIMAHFSHAYTDGGSIYFTFVSSAKDAAEAERKHKEIWRTAMNKAIEHKATVSHHHGIGLSKAEYLKRELGDFFPALAALKAAWDPDAGFNPGKLGLG